MKLSFSFLLFLLPVVNGAGCPFLEMQQRKAGYTPSYEAIYENFHQRRLNPNERAGDYGVPEGGYAAVRDEIAKVLTVSQDFWPADFGNYGGLMIRLAWHCSGSYRESDGRGGCDGGRIRFAPELVWPDNGNLDKALKILEPIKDMFGSSLSWGDLIILAGNTAIETMGGPILGFCGGRVDDADGADSLILGPSPIQEAIAPCVDIGEQGRCTSPLGPTTVGLIYVNPAGPQPSGHGDPIASGEDIRNSFGRMGFNDRESVSLIGGGHAFGKAHGACPEAERPCTVFASDGPGIGLNTATSGFEGKWTTRPTEWTNEFFENLFQFNWTSETGPGGALQWAPEEETAPDIFMLTSDIALSVDAMYKPISEEYRDDITSLENDFKASWYRLTTGDMGPPSRCLGSEIPEAQPFQYALPDSPAEVPDFIPVRTEIQSLIDSDAMNIGKFSMLAKMCANTFRETDYRGGCNGARIRFSPEIDWESNAGASDALAILEPVKTKYPDVTYADLIVLAGQTAVEAAGGKAMDFCGGRVDAADGAGSDILAPRVYESIATVVLVKDDMEVKGLSYEEGVALYAMPKDGTLSNKYFSDLKEDSSAFSEMEQALLEEPFAAIVDDFIADNDMFLMMFMKGWTKMMTADRYKGPVMNACTGVSHATKAEEPTSAPTSASPGTSILIGSIVALFSFLF